MANRDCCRGLRKTYNAVLNFLASNNLVVSVFCGAPIYYIIGLIIAYSQTYEWAILYGANYSCLSVLVLAWIVCIICLYRQMPNGLTFSIFILKALGYWAFVSSFILMFYGASQLPTKLTAFLFVALAPQVGLLLFTADVLRAARSRIYTKLEAPPQQMEPVTVNVVN